MTMIIWRGAARAGALCLVLLVAMSAGAAAGAAPVLRAVGAENFYADVIAQIGGARVSVVAIMSNPSMDPHVYESSTRDAGAVAGADLVVQNGLGYDAFMRKLEEASPNAGRTVLDVGAALGYAPGANPHVWYNPATMPRLAALVAAALTRHDRAHATLFGANLRAFVASLRPWMALTSSLHRRFRGVPVAVTEPVFGYAAAAIGLDVRTPASFQMAVMQGNDPAPQDSQAVQDLLAHNRVKLLIYNQQAVVPVTVRLLALAHARHIPVVGVYESMPRHMTYQRWMLAEAQAVDRALSHGTSTEQVR